ncbi:MAG: alpha/beta hydrolase [Candidatus Liptonbacteria bacterium]|nr:alpha/beta hydrolase [Candidatus Liptonbacteria bacterium]
MPFEYPSGSFAEVKSKGEGADAIKVYETENGLVEVELKKIEPSPEAEKHKTKEKESLTEAVLFMPGWSMTPESKSARELSQSFADYANVPAYEIFARAEKISGSGQLGHEAEAIRRFIEESGLNNVVISGHSQGGDRAIDLTVLLQERNPEIKIRGLVLMNTVGLHEQGKAALVGNFAKDAAIGTPKSVMKTVLGISRHFKGEGSFPKRSVRPLVDGLFGIIREAGKSGAGYPKRFLNEISNMAKANEHITEVNVPVILVQGERDPISAHEKIAPVDKPSEREKLLKVNLFKNSPYVRMVVAEKAGHHNMPLFRPESVARASLYMLERFYRSKEK